MVHCSSRPTTFNGRVVPPPLPLEFALTSLCCKNLTVYEPFVYMLWSFVFMYRCVLVRLIIKGMKIMVWCFVRSLDKLRICNIRHEFGFVYLAKFFDF